MSIEIINPKVSDLGDGFTVRRSLPSVKKRMVGPFVFWDHMGPVKITPEKQMDVRPHPHIGLSTITYLFSGQILHRDSLGNEVFIRPGEVNWMTAGEWIVHSERSHVIEDSFDLEGIQLWLALPKEHETIAPSFVHKEESSLPKISRPGIEMTLVAGEFSGERSPLPVHSDLFYLAGTADEASEIDLQLTAKQEAAVYVISGALQAEDGSVVEEYQMAWGDVGESLRFQATQDSKFMVLGGEPLPERRNLWWNFVASDMSLIEKAKEKWKSQDFDKEVFRNCLKIKNPLSFRLTRGWDMHLLFTAKPGPRISVAF